MQEFLPQYNVYAILGGVPAYLERWDDQDTLADPNLHLIERGLTHRLWQMLEDNFVHLWP